MDKVTYEITAVGLKDYIFRTPVVYKDEYGKRQVKNHELNDSLYIKKITLLFKVGRNNKSEMVFSEPLDDVNIFLLSHHIDKEKKESSQHSKALISYFTFLLDLQNKWNPKTTHLPKPDWDVMAVRKNQRPTYQYRAALKYSVLKEEDPELKLARSTASAYMRCVVAFYKFHLLKEKEFQYPPFDHEVININFEAGGTSMKNYQTKAVQTTDLRLNFGKDRRNNGTPQKLLPLSNTEWNTVDEVLRNGRIIKNVNGEFEWASLSYEYSLLFRFVRYTGMRRIEISSLHSEQLPDPFSQNNNPLIRMVIGSEAGSFTKGKDGDSPSRIVHVPVNLMKELVEYSRTERYLTRLEKYRSIYEQKYQNNIDVDVNKRYLFLSNTGRPIFTELTSINNRWTEVRNTVSQKLNVSFTHKPHNLRSTYAVSIFRALLKTHDPEQALSYVSARLGHADLATTLEYLKIAQDAPTGDEIYEDVLDFLGVFDELDETIFGVLDKD